MPDGKYIIGLLLLMPAILFGQVISRNELRNTNNLIRAHTVARDGGAGTNLTAVSRNTDPAMNLDQQGSVGAATILAWRSNGVIRYTASLLNNGNFRITDAINGVNFLEYDDDLSYLVLAAASNHFNGVVYFDNDFFLTNPGSNAAPVAALVIGSDGKVQHGEVLNSASLADMAPIVYDTIADMIAASPATNVVYVKARSGTNGIGGGLFELRGTNGFTTNTGTIFASQAPKKFWFRVENTYVNPEWFGAVAGSGNVQPAVQAAFNYAMQANVVGNNIPIQFPKGVFEFTSPLLLTNVRSLIVLGSGKNNTTLQSSYAGPVIRTDGCWYSQFEGFYFKASVGYTGAVFELDGNRAQDGVNFGVQGNTFKDCTFDGALVVAEGLAIVKAGMNFGQGSENLFWNCHFINCTNAGYNQYSHNALNNTFLGGNVASCYQYGLRADRGFFNVYSMGFQNGVSNQLGYDISLASAALDAVTVEGCRSESMRGVEGGSAIVSVKNWSHVISPDAWAASTLYASGAVVVPTTANGFAYRATTGGTSSNTEPVWVYGNNQDGPVVWATIQDDVIDAHSLVDSSITYGRVNIGSRGTVAGNAFGGILTGNRFTRTNFLSNTPYSFVDGDYGNGPVAFGNFVQAVTGRPLTNWSFNTVAARDIVQFGKRPLLFSAGSGGDAWKDVGVHSRNDGVEAGAQETNDVSHNVLPIVGSLGKRRQMTAVGEPLDIVGGLGTNELGGGPIRFWVQKPGSTSAVLVAYISTNGWLVDMNGNRYPTNSTGIDGGGGGGEANTGSNLGAGLNTYDSKSGVDLRFNTFSNAGDGVTISSNANLFTINVDWGKVMSQTNATAMSNAIVALITGGIAAGDSGAVQFNQGDAFAGTNEFRFDRTNRVFYVPGGIFLSNTAAGVTFRRATADGGSTHSDSWEHAGLVSFSVLGTSNLWRVVPDIGSSGPDFIRAERDTRKLTLGTDSGGASLNDVVVDATLTTRSNLVSGGSVTASGSGAAVLTLSNTVDSTKVTLTSAGGAAVVSGNFKYTIALPAITVSNLVVSGATNTIECVGLTNIVLTNILEEATGTRSETVVLIRNTLGVSVPIVWPAYGAQHGYFFNTNAAHDVRAITACPPGTNMAIAVAQVGTNTFAAVNTYPRP